jgi:pimeloyl-ACP methyl ester carboxylesterase
MNMPSISKNCITMRSLTVKVLLWTVVVMSGWLGSGVQSVFGANPAPSIPTFSTAEIGRQGHFYVGGHYAGAPGKETMDGAMYVEVWVPKKIRHPYPVVFMTGGGGQGSYAVMQTPDGRPGWAYDFVRQGYTVYMMDYPGQGRSAYVPELDGTLVPPRSGPRMEESWTGGRPPVNPASWPQAGKYTQWPSDAPNKGKMGDPVFDYLAKTEIAVVAYPNPATPVSPSTLGQERRTADAVEQLLDTIGQPVILMLNSGVATSGWVVADERSKLIKGILAVEPVAPPIENAELGATGPGRLWGLTNLPVHYDPPIKEASELKTVRQDKADGPDLIPCWIQAEPARKLANLEAVPVLDVSGEASYHRPYAHCVAKWLNQAGVKTEFVRLEDVGLKGNNHQMMSEKNSAEIARYLQKWIEKNIH